MTAYEKYLVETSDDVSQLGQKLYAEMLNGSEASYETFRKYSTFVHNDNFNLSDPINELNVMMVAACLFTVYKAEKLVHDTLN